MMNKNLCRSVYIIGLLVACGAVNAQVSLPAVGSDLPRLPTDLDADRRLRSGIDVKTNTATKLAEGWIDTGELTVAQVSAQATNLASGALRELQITQDPDGADIEDRVVVIPVEDEDVAGLNLAGGEVVSRRALPSLGMTMLTLRLPSGAELPDDLEDLRNLGPEAVIDYNHLYEFTASSRTAVTDVEGSALETAEAKDVDLRIGIIDSAVMPEHRGIAEIAIVNRDFVTTPGLRPKTHGTAVASLVAKSAHNQATVYAASVFFQLPNSAPGATAESLVAALDWLVTEQVDVINMSLAGPGNALLEAAIARLVEKNTVVVAAVGNNGPSGEPLYPAAYDGVIGVTAVDEKNKVLRYANRGEQVQFAARGVDVRVADSLSGGWRIESGTSMASPHVAVVAAQLLRSRTVQADAVQSWLMANSKDLGRKGFDPVYGYGLITQPPIIVSANQDLSRN